MVGEDGIAGAVLVEFTLFVPMLVIMFAGTINLGFYFFNYLPAQNAAQAGAQWAIANHVYNSSAIATAAQNATPAVPVTVSSSEFCACPSASGWTNQSSGVCAAGTTCSGLTGSPLAGTYVTVTAAPTRYQSLAPYGLFSTSAISASVTTRIQ
jgi:Flp pilus assembly protein TadG